MARTKHKPRGAIGAIVTTTGRRPTSKPASQQHREKTRCMRTGNHTRHPLCQAKGKIEKAPVRHLGVIDLSDSDHEQQTSVGKLKKAPIRHLGVIEGLGRRASLESLELDVASTGTDESMDVPIAMTIYIMHPRSRIKRVPHTTFIAIGN
ncbi:hypothetical protein BJ912DRAFT_923912 [Pholiota molesta]|nr:hypothetical protein BJ912DRAFT_923912 [Pholiota molesta]